LVGDETMKNKSIRWQLSLSYAGIALLATLLLGAIMLVILARYFAIQESNYLIETASELGGKIFYAMDEDLKDEQLNGYIESFSFYVNGQIRLLDPDGRIMADSGPPKPITRILLAEKSDEKTSLPDKPDQEAVAFARDISIGRANNSPFSSWLFSIQEDELTSIREDERDVERRSQQVITQAYYNKQGQLLGYVELSNGPAYGRDILRSVAWGWAIAALAAVLLAAAAGVWVSRRFSTPLENLTQTTARMAAGDLSARADIERQDEFGLLANSFNKMADTIEDKVAALRRFVADAAHELGTPLTALRTNLELVDDPQITPTLEQVERMDSLTRSLLDLSHLEAAGSDTHFEDVDLVGLLRTIAEPYASRAEQEEISFSLDPGPDSVIIQGVSTQLSILIQNLLDNAIKFTPAGGQVDVVLNKQDDAVQLKVADTGIGIPEEDLPHLFSRFHRGSNAAAYPGSGLGLAIVKAIADQHGASIAVESEHNGTEFVVQFNHSI
jgi:signal transduction histidine kinase